MSDLQATVTADGIGETFSAFGINGTVTACFGRTDSVHADPHSGADIAFSHGQGIPALAGGKCVYASEAGDGGWAAIFGTSRIIDHMDGTRALYAHMMAGTAQIAVGDAVAAGEIIGTQGSTGLSTGDHLHLGLTTDENPWFNKDADGGVSRLLNPLEHLTGAGTAAPGALAGVAAEPSQQDVVAHAAQYVADAALRLRREVERGAPAFVLTGYVDDLVTRATALGESAKALQ